ncbi:MAG: hypothetical protein WHS38_09550 [Thermodesulforhabdaceae bacterium]
MNYTVACVTEKGIIIGNDEKTLSFSEGELKYLDYDRFFKVGDKALIASGGFLEAANLASKAASFLEEEKIDDVKEMYQAAIAYLSGEYDRFMRKHCEIMPIDPTHYMTFILGGYSPRDSKYHLYLIWNRKKLPQLDGEEIGSVFTIPRLVSLELTVSKIIAEGKNMDEILAVLKDRLEKIGDKEDYTPRWNYAILDESGIRFLK